MTDMALAIPPPHIRRRIGLKGFLVGLSVALLLVWTAVPLFMAVMWSLVNPDDPWSPPAVLPPSFSLAQWEYVFTFSEIGKAIVTSFVLAPVVTILSFILSLPTAYAIGRLSFRGKEALRLLILLPIVLPAMVIAMFLSRTFYAFGLAQTFLGLVLGHTLLSMPYMLRILATAFEAIPQDVIDAARNLGAGRLELVRHILVPMVLPGLMAGSVFTFITSLEEFNLTFVIGTPTFQTIPTVLFDYLGYHFVRTNAAVVSIVLMVPSIALLLIAERYLKTEYLSSAFGKL
ncbi:ABC transporter permease subunit [Mesorhizobium sp. LHD-90]|uniref:ABC transporter permease n=1 Tax=Mesorhizobium sp. LHD-90 TaxID=3071414 RepID=UPI0027DED4C8|nr:ABC transporter permease subunit [Mesorhizobium sp. LHD-90]MDQ6435343.1 ABC transporter permease subunit [Mesorhizobium sp. LHD-90]